MNFNEILKAKGITDETIASILEDMKANNIFTAGEENLDVRYGKLKTQHEGVSKQLTEANNLIKQLQEGAVGQEALQAKLTEYEKNAEKMQEELQKTKEDAALKVALLASKAIDPEYMAFKVREKLNKEGKSLTLDDNGDIKDWSDILSGLQTEHPKQFEEAEEGKDGMKVWEPNKLKSGDGGKHTPSKEDFRGMTYEQRLALKNDNPELFKRLAY